MTRTSVRPELVRSIDDIRESMRLFNQGLAESPALQSRLSKFSSWYFIPGTGLGPSKFIGYKMMTSKAYLDASGTHGGETEKHLQHYFQRARGKASAAAEEELRKLLERYGKTPRRGARLNVLMRQHTPKVNLKEVAARTTDACWVNGRLEEFLAHKRYGPEEVRMRNLGALAREQLDAGNVTGLAHLVNIIRTKWSIRGAGPTSDRAMVAAVQENYLDLVAFTSAPLDGRVRESGARMQAVVESAASRGAGRHWSWTSKVLHWLFPAHFAVYDKIVRECFLPDEKRHLYEGLLRAEVEAVAAWPDEQDWPVEITSSLRAIDAAVWYYAKHGTP